MKKIFSLLVAALMMAAIAAAPLAAEAASSPAVKKSAAKVTKKKTASKKPLAKSKVASKKAKATAVKKASVKKKSTTARKAAPARVAAATAAVAPAVAVPALAAEPVVMRPPAESVGKSASDVVKDFYATLVNVMKDGGSLGFSGRYEKMQAAIDRAFNTQDMIRTASGPTWVKTAPEKQDSLAQAFRNFTVANYASQFKSFDGEQFTVVGEKPGSQDGEKIVQTTLVSGSETRELNYLMRKGARGWQIVDVYVDGTISEMATRRGEFGSVLRKDGADALLNLLEQKSKAMGDS